MLMNYCKIAWRHLRKNPGYSFINILGLATGLACFILILLFVQHELSYDRFNENADQVYRLIQRRPASSGASYWATTSPAMAATLQREFPEVKAAATVLPAFNPLLSLGDNRFTEEGIMTDAHFLDIFSFPLLEGNPATVLKDPNSIILTTSLARKIFGSKDPMGQTLIYQDKTPHIVTGIMADVPENAHLSFSYILPVAAEPYYTSTVNRQPWYNNGVYTYVLLHNGASATVLEDKMRAYINRNLADWRPEDRMTFLFQPLKDIHLQSQHLDTFAFEKSGSYKYVYLFLGIGFVILLLACANYTNLAVARSIRRAQEVGLRKVAGAWRGQLIAQFLGESLFVTMMALALALGLVHLLLPFFGQLMDRPMHISYLRNPLLLPGLLLLMLIVSLLSGGYPAFLVTALRPADALTGKSSVRAGSFRIQRVLIVGQYAASITLVAGSFIIHRQMQFVQHRELGYTREHVLTVRVSDKAVGEQYTTIREALLRDPHVTTMSYSHSLPTDMGMNQSMFDWEGSQGKLLPSHTAAVDYDFLDVYGIKLVAGRGFSRTFGTDTMGAPIALINEAAVKALGWTPEKAIGKVFNYSDGRGKRTIIGVMKDFHFNSVHHALEPLVLTLNHTETGYISARIRPDDLPATIAAFQRAVSQLTPYPFEYQFLNDSFNQLYKSDRRLGDMFGFFTLLAILIASLGLFGLAAYTSEQRKKEIGVRKVLGASVASIVTMLSKEYIKLIGFGFVIAVPAAWYLMHRWLENFTYRIDISWWMFALAGLLAAVTALLAVSFQSVKAALMNPVRSLRS